MNWKDVKKLIKEEGYDDEDIQRVKAEVKNEYGDYLEDKNLLWRKIALELDVKIADDQLSSSRELTKVTVDDLKNMDEPEEENVSYELEGFFFDIQRGEKTSTGKPKTKFKFCDESGIISGAVYGDQSIANEMEPCTWYRVKNAGRYVPLKDAIMTVGQYADLEEVKGIGVNEKVEKSAIGEFKGTEDFPFDSDDREDKIKWVRGLVTDESTFEYSGCEKCNYKFDEDSGKCNNEECDGTIEENQATRYFYTMKIHVPGVGGYEFSMPPNHATGDENYRKDFVEAIIRGYDSGGEDGENLNIMGVNRLGPDKEKQVKQEKQRKEMEKKKAEADEGEWSDAMKAVNDALSDGKVRTTEELTEMTDFDRGAVVTAAARLEEKLGIISYPEAGKITRKDVETPELDKPDEEEEDEDMFDKEKLNEIYDLMSDGRIWTSSAVGSRAESVDVDEVGSLLTEMQGKVDTVEFAGLDQFQRTDVEQMDEVVQPGESEEEEEPEETEEEPDEIEEESEGDSKEEESEETEEEEEEEEEFECPMEGCDKTYATKGWLNRHLNQEHGGDGGGDGEESDAEEEKEDTSGEPQGQASLDDLDEKGDESAAETKTESDEEDEEETETTEEPESEVPVMEPEKVREAVKSGVDEKVADAIVEGYTWVKQFGESPVAGIEKKLNNEFDLSEDEMEQVKESIGSVPCVIQDDYLYKIMSEE